MLISRTDRALGDVTAVSVGRGNTNPNTPELRGHTWPVPGARAGTRALQDPVASSGTDPTGTCQERGNTTEQSCFPQHLPSHPLIPASVPSSGTCLPPALSPTVSPDPTHVLSSEADCEPVREPQDHGATVPPDTGGRGWLWLQQPLSLQEFSVSLCSHAPMQLTAFWRTSPVPSEDL